MIYTASHGSVVESEITRLIIDLFNLEEKCMNVDKQSEFRKLFDELITVITTKFHG